MEKALEKLLRKLLLEKYPIYLDVHVDEGGRYDPNQKICFEVFLIIFDKYYGGLQNLSKAKNKTIRRNKYIRLFEGKIKNSLFPLRVKLS